MHTDTIKRTTRNEKNCVNIDCEIIKSFLDTCAGEKCHICIDGFDRFIIIPTSYGIDIDILKEYGIQYIDTRFISTTKSKIYVGTKIMNEIKKIQRIKDEEPFLEFIILFSEEIQLDLIYFDILN